MDIAEDSFDKYVIQVVQEAIENTDPVYWGQLCASRAEHDPAQAGSYFKSFEADHVNRLIRGCKETGIRPLLWAPYTHEAVKAPACCFIAPGVTNAFANIVHIDAVPSEAVLVFEDPKNTGMVEAVWEQESAGHRAGFVTLIIGPAPAEPHKMVVYTFHPGDPVAPSQVKRVVEVYDDDMQSTLAVDRHRTYLRALEAKELGVSWVKMRSNGLR